MVRRFMVWWVAAFRMKRSPVWRLVTKTWLPSGVNFRRFWPAAFASIVVDSCFVVRLITAMVPSSLAAVQSWVPSGDTSKPSEPRLTAMTVWSHCSRAGGGPGRGAGPAEFGAPGGGCAEPGGGPDVVDEPGGGLAAPGGGPGGPARIR